MITLIIGKKGSGKTKKLVDLVNETTKNAKGSVVCIEKGNVMTFNVSHRARLIDSDAYSISGYDEFIGFVSGICAGNYDISDVFIDSTLKIGGTDLKSFADFIEKLKKLADSSSVKFTLSVSADDSELPAKISELAQKI